MDLMLVEWVQVNVVRNIGQVNVIINTSVQVISHVRLAVIVIVRVHSVQNTVVVLEYVNHLLRICSITSQTVTNGVP